MGSRQGIRGCVIPGLNKVQIIGYLGRDPEMRYTANGSALTNFSVAVGESYTQDGQRHETTEWFNVTAWNKLAELCGQHLTKGRLVYIEGKLTTRSWDGTDGQKHYRTEVVARQVTFLDRAQGGDGGHPGYDRPGPDDVDPEDLPFQ